MALIANDAEDRVEQLTLLTERLTALIAEQALAFEQRSQASVYGAGGLQSGGAPATAITLNKRA